MKNAASFDELLVLVSGYQPVPQLKRAFAAARNLSTGKDGQVFRHAPVTMVVDGTRKQIDELNRVYDGRIPIVDAAAFLPRSERSYRLVTTCKSARLPSMDGLAEFERCPGMDSSHS